MDKINWNKKRDEWAEGMNPCPVWNEGTEAQQEFADNLVKEFCNRFAKYLCWSVRNNLIKLDEAEDLVNNMFFAINDIDDSKWWCNKKDSNDFSIALKLMKDYEFEQDIINKLRKEYQ